MLGLSNQVYPCFWVSVGDPSFHLLASFVTTTATMACICISTPLIRKHRHTQLNHKPWANIQQSKVETASFDWQTGVEVKAGKKAAFVVGGIALLRLRDGDRGDHPSGGCSQWGSGSHLRCGRSEIKTTEIWGANAGGREIDVCEMNFIKLARRQNENDDV